MKPRNKQSASRRKSSTRNRSGIVGSSSIPRNYMSTHIAGVAPHVRRTLSWTYNYGNALTGGGVYTEYVAITLNGPYDPDVAIGGLSAAGFAKYMALYSKCFVLSARAVTKFALSGASYSAGNPAMTIVGQTISTFSSSLGSTVAAVNAGLVDYVVINQHPDSGVLRSAVNVARFVDKPDILDDPEFYCTSGSNSTQVIVLHVWAVVPSGIVAGYLNSIINVEFDCVFTDPIPFS